MTTREEAERIAAAVNTIRPGWPISSLVTLIGQHHQHRPARDVGAALMWVALDPDSRTPGRVNESGPWWPTAVTARPTEQPQPPRMTPGELTPRQATDAEAARQHLARLRQIAATAPRPTPREDRL